MGETLKIGGVEVPPGQRSTIDLPFARLYTHTPMTMPVQVVRGKEPGPRLFVTAGLHGDELNGVEVVRRVLRLPELQEGLKGDVIGVPMVNVLGFIAHSRYLPDRRDLNRSFPGSKKGSLTAQLAHLLMEEVVAKSTHGIDLHTGGLHRTNLPHVRARLADPETRRLAVAFGAPVMVDADLRDGSLRQAVIEHGKPMLLYEGGEALRFDDLAIRAGVRGIVNVMRAIGMLPPAPPDPEAVAAAAVPGNKKNEPVAARSTMWVRAPISGILRATVALGARVKKGEVLGVLGDLYGEHEEPVLSSHSGIVIGRIQLPLVHRGDALFHVARFARTTSAATQLATFQAVMDAEVAVPEAALPGAPGPVAAAPGKNGKPETPAPEAKPEKPAEKTEKVAEKAEKNDKSEKAEKNDKSEKAEKNDKSEKAEKNDKSEKAEKSDKSEKAEKSDKSEKAEKSDKSEKAEKNDKPEKGASSRLAAEGDKGKK